MAAGLRRRLQSQQRSLEGLQARAPITRLLESALADRRPQHAEAVRLTHEEITLRTWRLNVTTGPATISAFLKRYRVLVRSSLPKAEL